MGGIGGGEGFVREGGREGEGGERGERMGEREERMGEKRMGGGGGGSTRLRV